MRNFYKYQDLIHDMLVQRLLSRISPENFIWTDDDDYNRLEDIDDLCRDVMTEKEYDLSLVISLSDVDYPEEGVLTFGYLNGEITITHYLATEYDGKITLPISRSGKPTLREKEAIFKLYYYKQILPDLSMSDFRIWGSKDHKGYEHLAKYLEGPRPVYRTIEEG